MFRYLNGVLGERLAAKPEASGFVVLGWYDGGARSFYCANKPINSAADLVGQKIRVQPSETYIDMVTRLGAKPVTVPFKEVLDALQQKKVDCAENNMPSYEARGHHKMAKSLYLTNHVVSPEALVVSTKLWNALSTEDKALFKNSGPEIGARDA